MYFAGASSTPCWHKYVSVAASKYAPALWGARPALHVQPTAANTADAACRQFFEAQHSELLPVLEALGADMQAAASLARFQLAAATVRARLLPTFPMDQPCLVPGTEWVRAADRSSHNHPPGACCVSLLMHVCCLQRHGVIHTLALLSHQTAPTRVSLPSIEQCRAPERPPGDHIRWQGVSGTIEHCGCCQADGGEGGRRACRSCTAAGRPPASG